MNLTEFFDWYDVVSDLTEIRSFRAKS